MNLKLLLSAGLAVVACAAPAAAGAATISEENGAIVYRGEGSEGLSLLISDRDPDTWGETPKPRRLSFSDSGADRFVVTTPLCWDASSAYGNGVECEFSDSRPIRVEGSAAKDSIGIFSADDVPDSIPIEIDGRGGDDTIKDAYNGTAGRTFRGGDGNDTLYGYAGNDRLFGDGGNDADLDGGEGDDEVRGGDGDDTLWGDRYKAPGADIIDGGNGTDFIDGEWNIPSDSQHPPATVSLDGQANDGRPGEGDNVLGVEKINGYVAMSFTGTDAAEIVDIVNPSDPGASNALRGMGGNDRLVAKDAADTVDGGAGDDHVEGGYNNDTVVGGPGKDMIYGDKTGSQSCWYSCNVPFGNDTIEARDGEADTIDCGVGEDTAVVDAIDTVANCESVQRSGTGGPGPGGPGPGGPGPGTGNGRPPAAATVTLAGARKLSALTKGKLSARVACAAACKVTATLTIGGRKVAAGSSTLLAAGTAKARLKVGKPAARRLKKLRKATGTLKVTIQSASGKRVVTRKVSLTK